jgi:hypothetical protein
LDRKENKILVSRNSQENSLHSSMYSDDFPSYSLCQSDQIFVSFEDDLFYEQNPNTEPLFGDVTEATTTFCSLTFTIPTSPLFPFQNSPESLSTQPMSSSDLKWDVKGCEVKGKSRELRTTSQLNKERRRSRLKERFLGLLRLRTRAFLWRIT